MNAPFSLFLALKYLRPKRTFISIVTIISTLGVLLGVAVLIIVLSVMSGFDLMWREKILAFNSHITVTPYAGGETDEDLVQRIRGQPGVTGAAPYVQGLVFLNHEKQVLSPVLRGIDPEFEGSVSEVPKHIVAGRFDVEDDGVVIGVDLARRLGLQVGDQILVYSPQTFARKDSLRLPEELEVRGIFDLGMYNFDIGFVLASIRTARDLYGGPGGGMPGIQVMLENPNPVPVAKAAGELVRLLGPGCEVETWMEQNRQLFDALQVEKNMMFFLLVFIMVVASFGIANTLITVTVQKTREIGLLRALGFSSGAVMRVFLWQGWIVGILGTALGIGAGLLVLEHRNQLLDFLSRRAGIDLLPKALYQLPEIPAHTNPSDVLQVVVIVMVLCTLAGLIPAWRAARLDPARALRYE